MIHDCGLPLNNLSQNLLNDNYLIIPTKYPIYVENEFIQQLEPIIQQNYHRQLQNIYQDTYRIMLQNNDQNVTTLRETFTLNHVPLFVIYPTNCHWNNHQFVKSEYQPSTNIVFTMEQYGTYADYQKVINTITSLAHRYPNRTLFVPDDCQIDTELSNIIYLK